MNNALNMMNVINYKHLWLRGGEKAVFHVGYELKLDEFCPKANKNNFSSLKINFDLAGERLSCRDNLK